MGLICCIYKPKNHGKSGVIEFQLFNIKFVNQKLTAKMNPLPDNNTEIESNDTESTNLVEKINYNEKSVDQLVSFAQDIINRQNILLASKEMEALRVAFYKKINLEKHDILQTFLKNGGLEDEFKAVPSPQEKTFKEILLKYRDKKEKARKQQEREYAKNLKIKNDIISDIHGLINSKETIKDTFVKFKELQEKWRNTGEVAMAFRNDSWKSYHHHVEKFYDFIKINKELRDLDFNKNHQLKVILCEQTEALMEEKSINKMNEELQMLHEKWKQIGPVKPEYRESIWERFKQASRQLNKKHNDHYTNLKEKGLEHLNAKSSICDQIKELATQKADNHKQWSELTEQVQFLEEKWRKEGPIRKDDLKSARSEFKKSLDIFYNKRNEFYKSKKEESVQVVNQKIDLCEQIENINAIETQDWNKQTQKVLNIQEKWKKSGYLPKSKSEKLWKRFKSALDVFFENKRTFYATKDEQKVRHLSEKETLFETIKSFELNSDMKKNKETIGAFMKQWREIGPVPRDKQQIETSFRKTIDIFFAKMKIERDELEEIRFKDKIERLKQSTNHDAILKEKKYLKNKIDILQKEVNQYETNMAFFKNSKGTEKLKNQVVSKIEKNQATIKSLRKKLKLISAI